MEALLYFIQGVLELTGVLAFNLALLRVKFDWKKTVITGVLFMFIIIFFRSLPIPFGVHTLVGFMLFFVYIRKTTKKPILNIVVAILSSIFILAVLEMLMHQVFVHMMNITSDELINDNVLWKLEGIPNGIIFIFLAVFASKILTPIEYENKYLGRM